MLPVKFLLSRINGDAPRASNIQGGGVWMSTRAGRKQFQKPLYFLSTRTLAFAADRYIEATLVQKLLLTLLMNFLRKRKNYILCP
jgi:hypothetical protein